MQEVEFLVARVFRLATETLTGNIVYGRWNTDRKHVEAWRKESLGSGGTKAASIETGCVYAKETEYGFVATIGNLLLTSGHKTPSDALAAGLAIVQARGFSADRLATWNESEIPNFQ
jgi:hypothetical protein